MRYVGNPFNIDPSEVRLSGVKNYLLGALVVTILCFVLSNLTIFVNSSFSLVSIITNFLIVFLASITPYVSDFKRFRVIPSLVLKYVLRKPFILIYLFFHITIITVALLITPFGITKYAPEVLPLLIMPAILWGMSGVARTLLEKTPLVIEEQKGTIEYVAANFGWCRLSCFLAAFLSVLLELYILLPKAVIGIEHLILIVVPMLWVGLYFLHHVIPGLIPYLHPSDRFFNTVRTLKLVNSSPGITQAKVASELNFSDAQTEKILSELCGIFLIKRGRRHYLTDHHLYLWKI